MIEQKWIHEGRKTIVCVDGYQKGVLSGRIYNTYSEPQGFESLSQFLLKMEALLDELQLPQSYTETRTFAPLVEPINSLSPPPSIRKGTQATFEVQVIFRQHTSWQGVVIWLEQHLEQSFRSVLELVLLMDSALRKLEGCDPK